MKKPATPKARALLLKLQALAERGINGEKATAQKKLASLKRRYDFTAANKGGADIFDGVFIPSTEAAPIMQFEPVAFDIGNAVKWAIEGQTGIRCLFRGGRLCAQAEAVTANRLHDIAAKLAAEFSLLWVQFQSTPQANPSDRANFVMGLYEGMVDEVRHGEQLPSRAKVEKVKRAKKRDVAAVAGLALHPYTVAAGLGRQVRLCVPLVDIAGQLEQAVKGEIAA